MQQPLIEIQSLDFRYRGASDSALRGIELRIHEGEFVAVMGSNEAGKSTLCLTLNGLIPHLVKGFLQGSVRVNGDNTREHGVKHFFPIVGLVFQDFESQLFSTAVELEVAFGPENLGLPLEEMGRRIDRALDVTAISNLRGRQPATLSGGQKQLLAIASVLSLNPKILCFDEPTTDLDPKNKRRIFSITEKLADKKQTLIIVEHETEEALSAHRIVLMHRGQIIAQGPPDLIFRNIPLLEQCNVMPLQVTQLFHNLAFGELPLRVEEALGIWKKNSLTLLPNSRERLAATDQSRTRAYGRPFLNVDKAHFAYENGVEALGEVSLQVREGEFVAILGQNGSGKTTLAKLLNGLLKPARGLVSIDGLNTADLSAGEIGKEVGYVFQNPDHQIFKETIFDEVLFGPRNFGLDSAQSEQQARDALETVGLWERRLEDPFMLPKGLRQKVAVASVLATRPRAIIMDEPTTGLDYGELEQMMALVKRLNEAGHTIIIITHCIWIAAQYAHRTVLMSRGAIIADGPTREIFAREDLLDKADIRAPQIVQFSNALGTTMLSVTEFLNCCEPRSFRK
jgi:energy-coupling factor transport system ATP-binding protein